MKDTQTLRYLTDTLLGIGPEEDPNTFSANLHAARGIVAALLLVGDELYELRKVLEAKR